MVEAKSLRKFVVPHSILQSPSPGNLQSTRLALHVNGDSSSLSVYIASGCRVYRVEVSMEDTMVMKGKESLLIPASAEVLNSGTVNRCPHRAEIQSVVLAEADGSTGVILGSVDSYGHLIVSQLDTSGQDIDRPAYSILPRDSGVGEGSWAGLCFSPSSWAMGEDLFLKLMGIRIKATSFMPCSSWILQNSSLETAVARSFCKSIDIYDQEIPLRSLYTLWYPASLCFQQNSFSGNDDSSTLLVAEGCQFSVWDLRTSHNGGCVERVCGSLGDPFYAICCSSTGAVAVGGAERTVSIYDPRRWSALSRWVNCSKYEITGLCFSSVDSDHIYIQGVDYEVFCGSWKERKKVFSFRGDSNWLGFSKALATDVLAGWCESGSIFVADVVKGQQVNNTQACSIDDLWQAACG